MLVALAPALACKTLHTVDIDLLSPQSELRYNRNPVGFINGEIQRLDQIAQVAQKLLQLSEQLQQLVQETAVKERRTEKMV